MKKKEEIKTLVDSYITENQLRPAEYLLKKELPASLMPLYEEKFDGMNMEGISTVEYLKEYKKADYTTMLMNGTLNMHLKEIQETADNKVQQIISELKAKSNLTEDMKNTDVLCWVGTMNSIKAQAEEIVFSELIYV